MSSSKPPFLEGATRDLAHFAANLRYEEIPEAVITRMKTSVLDSIGCCVFGATLPWTKLIQQMVRTEGCKPVSSMFGMGESTSVANAVLVNATAGHAFELDDIHKESIVHPGSIAVPIIVALAEERGLCSGRDFLTSMVAGYEVGTRVGNAATMSLFFRGFHPQGTSGVFVAAATAGRMLNLDASQMQHALGIVGSQAGGLMAAQEGAMVKRFHSGRAAQSGVYSAVLAKSGFTGITDVLEAAYGGYLSSYSDDPNPQRLMDGLGTDWEAGKVGYKPHASVTSIHSALDALAQILDENSLEADDVEHVEVGVSHMTFVHCAWDYKAQGVTAAQMNLYYGLAVMAFDRMAFVEQYRQERLDDPRILGFIKKIRAYGDPEIDGMGPAFRHAARVKIISKDGKTYSREIMNRRGSPENPLSHDDVEYKFRHVVNGCLSKDSIDRVIDLTQELDRLPDIKPLVDLLAAKY